MPCTRCWALGYYGHLYTGLTFVVASAAYDALDGSLARDLDRAAEFGLYFDGVADRFSELFFVIGAVLGAQVPPSAFIVVGGAFTLLLARSYDHRHHWGTVPTTFGRPERFSLLIVGVLCPTPIYTVLFIVAGLCCVLSSAQIIARGIAVQNERSERAPQRDV